jgi:hypothetical protein
MIFDSSQSVRDRLFNTFVLYRNRFYTIIAVSASDAPDDFLITLQDFGEVTLQVRVNDPEVIFQGFPLGFVNTNKGPFFTSRTGHRQYKQGINGDNIVINPVLTTQRRPPFNEYFCECLSKTVFNDYPALNTYIETGRSGAFSRYFAKIRDDLNYKTKIVGKFVDNVPVLDDQYKYLQESLDEAVNGTAT